MISYSDARDIIEQVACHHEVQSQWCRTEALAGQIAAHNILAPRAIQPFDNAAMDGFAVRLADFKDCTAPISLLLSGTLAAGDNASKHRLMPGQCMAIMTGAPIPASTDAVVPVEHTRQEGEHVVFLSQPKPGEHIRRAGEDLRVGDTLWHAGDRLGPAHMMAAASLGISGAEVRRPLRAVFIATGKELVNDLAAPLADGQIYNANRLYVEQVLHQLGVSLLGSHTVSDDPADFLGIARQILAEQPDLVISSGAVSAGEFDFVPRSLGKLGAEILFHKLSIKPGKPNLFARLPGGGVWFGLPGNPVATVVGLRFLVAPYLRAAAGRAPEQPMLAQLTREVSKRETLRVFLKARIHQQRGLLLVEPLAGQASFMISPMLTMNAWAIAPEGVDLIRAGEMIEVYPQLPDDCLQPYPRRLAAVAATPKNSISCCPVK